MTIAHEVADDWLAPPLFPPRRSRRRDARPSPVDDFLEALASSLEHQMDPALEANGILAPLGCVGRAVLVEQIGADLDAAVRDLLLSGVPLEQAERDAVHALGPPAQLGRALLRARRQEAVEAIEALERGRERLCWWIEPLVPVAGISLAILLTVLAPVLSVVVGIVAEHRLGTLAIGFVPLFCAVIVGVAETLAADVDMRLTR